MASGPSLLLPGMERPTANGQGVGLLTSALWRMRFQPSASVHHDAQPFASALSRAQPTTSVPTPRRQLISLSGSQECTSRGGETPCKLPRLRPASPLLSTGAVRPRRPPVSTTIGSPSCLTQRASDPGASDVDSSTSRTGNWRSESLDATIFAARSRRHAQPRRRRRNSRPACSFSTTWSAGSPCTPPISAEICTSW